MLFYGNQALVVAFYKQTKNTSVNQYSIRHIIKHVELHIKFCIFWSWHIKSELRLKWHELMVILHQSWPSTIKILLYFSISICYEGGYLPVVALIIQHFYSENRFQHYYNPFQILFQLQKQWAMSFLKNKECHVFIQKHKRPCFLSKYKYIVTHIYCILI